MARNAKPNNEPRPPADGNTFAPLLDGQVGYLLQPGGEDDRWIPAPPLPEPLLFPGSFNPLHEGHLAMAAAASARLGKPVYFEISVENVDKPPLSQSELRRRVSQFRRRPLCLTSAPTFQAKAALFPGATFLVGADTIVRIAEARYYEGADPDEAFTALAAASCRFLVFGRLLEDRFLTLEQLALPPGLLAICEGVDGSEFRADVSSTEIRRGR